MPETYTLTKNNYLYSFIDINSANADINNPPLKLAITTTNKTIAMSSNDNPTIINSGDKLIVHDTEISQSDRQTLAKLFYFTGKTLIYQPNWVNGLGYLFFGVNSDGCSILCVPQARETPTVVTKFILPLMFDWSNYNVKVPDSPLTKKQSQVDRLNEENLKLKNELQEKEQWMNKLEQQAVAVAETNDAKIKELEDKQSKLEEKESKIKELEEQISAMMQQEEEKNKNMEKLNQELLTLKLEMEKNNEEMKEKEGKNDELREKQSELEKELDGKNKELAEKESKIKSLGEQQWIMMQQQEEKNREMKKEIVSLNGKLSILREQIMIEEEAKINELREKLQEKENQLENESIIKLKQEQQIQKQNQERKKEEEEIKKLKEKQVILEQEMLEKNAKIIELQQQLHLKEEKVTKLDFQLVTNKLDQLLSTLQTGHLSQTLLQPLPIPEVVKSRSRNLVPDNFSISSEDLPQFTKQPQFRVSMKNIRVFTPIDENIDGKFPKEEICVYTSDHRFHKNEWWCINVAEHSNITMLAFYDGDMDEVSVHGNYVRVPFRPETSFRSNTQFFVGLIRGIGLRFMFLYQLI